MNRSTKSGAPPPTLRFVVRGRLLPGSLALLALSGCSEKSIVGPECSGSDSSETCSFTFPVTSAGDTISLPSGVTLIVPPGSTSSSGRLTVTDSPGVNPSAFADPTRSVRVTFSNSTATASDSLTIRLSLRLPRPVPTDSTVLVAVGVDGARYWADVQATAAAGTSSAFSLSRTSTGPVEILLAPIRLSWTVGSAVFHAVGTPNSSSNACDDIYDVAAASDAALRSAPSLTVVLIHGWQSDLVCGEGDGVYFGSLSDYEPEPEWTELISAIRADLPQANIYVVRYPSVLSPRTTGAVLATRAELGAPNLVLVGHSMGGLVARYVAQELAPGAVEAIVTLGTPHEGSLFATVAAGSRLYLFPPTEGLRSLAPGALSDMSWPAAPMHVFSGGVLCSYLPNSWKLWISHRILCAGLSLPIVVGDGLVSRASSEPQGSIRPVPPLELTATDHFQVKSHPQVIAGVVAVLRALSPPTIMSVSPSSGPIAGGTSVTITGIGFSGVTAVTIGGTALVNRIVVSSTSITGTTPASSTAGAKDVVVTTSAGSGTLTGCFTYNPAVTVTSVSPTSGPLTGGTAVTLTGTNVPATVDSVRVGTGRLGGVVRVSATQVTGTTPVGTAAGVVDVTVYTTGAGNGTCTGCFVYNPPVTVTGISPSSGTLAGGTPVTITGTLFADITSVTIGGAELVNLTVASSTQIVGTTPPSSTSGITDVVVRSARNGTATCRGFIYSDPPRRMFASSGQLDGGGASVAPSDLYDVPPVPCGTDRLIGRIRTSSGFEPVITDLALSQGGTLWAISFDALYRIDPTTAIATTVGPLGAAGANALAVDEAGSLFGAGNDLFFPGSFFRVDTLSGRATVVGYLGSGLSSSGDLAFGPDGRLFASAVTSSGDAILATVDRSNGTASLVRPGATIGFARVWGLAFVGADLFGLTRSSANATTGALIWVDASTGVGSKIRDLSFNAHGAGTAVWKSVRR